MSHRTAPNIFTQAALTRSERELIASLRQLQPITSANLAQVRIPGRSGEAVKTLLERLREDGQLPSVEVTPPLEGATTDNYVVTLSLADASSLGIHGIGKRPTRTFS